MLFSRWSSYVRYPTTIPFSKIGILAIHPLLVITLGFIEELDNERRLVGDKYPDFERTDQECDDIGRMCDPYEDL